VAVSRSNQRWCSDGFGFRCDNGEPLRVTFAPDCCDREAMSWAATTGGHSGDVVRGVMLAAVEHRFGNVRKAPAQIEWLSDNGSGYIADKTRAFASDIGLKPLTTPVCSSQSNGMAESFVKTMKRDYVAFMPKPDAATAVRNLAVLRTLQREASAQRAEITLATRVPTEERFINLSVRWCPEVRRLIQNLQR
jgi:putative transposase